MKQRVQGLVVGFILSMLVMGGATMLAATNRTIEVTYGVNVVIDGVSHEFTQDMRPFLSGGRVFVPLRGIADALDIDVAWDIGTMTAYLNRETPMAPARPEADAIIGSWQLEDFSAAYDRFIAPRDMMITFTEDGSMITMYDPSNFYEIDFEVVGSKIRLGPPHLYQDMLSPTLTFRVDGDMLILYQGLHFTRAYQDSDSGSLIGRWEIYAPLYTGRMYMELLEDGTALFEVPGDEVIYGYFYVYDDMVLLVWDYGMMVYFFEVSGDSLTLTLTTMGFSRVE